MKSIVWLLPLLFILHDMEEIILAMRWKKKEGSMKKHIKLPFVFFGNLKDTASFALGVYEELIILTLASMLGYFAGHYELWLGLLVAVVNLKLLHQCGDLFEGVLKKLQS